MEANDVLPLVTVEIDFNKQVLLILLIEFQSGFMHQMGKQQFQVGHIRYIAKWLQMF